MSLRPACVGVAAEVVSACYLKVLLSIKRAYSNMDGLNSVCRKQHNVGWYNVDDTGIVTPLNCLNAFVSFHQWNFPTALFCLLNK